MQALIQLSLDCQPLSCLNQSHDLVVRTTDYSRGDTAWGNLDAVDAALEMTGGADGDAVVALSVFFDVGECFE